MDLELSLICASAELEQPEISAQLQSNGYPVCLNNNQLVYAQIYISRSE